VTDVVPPDIARAVRLLDALRLPPEVVAEVTGCPPALAAEVAAGRIGDYDPAVVRADVALVALVDAARAKAGREPTADEIKKAARWLAEQSGHPRYTQVADGWRALLASTSDVEVAYHAALRRIGDLPGFRASQAVDSLRAARETLTRVAQAAEQAREEARQ
jgi:hypothetical protein